MKREIRPIDANALAAKIREYMADYPHAETRLAACRALLSMLGDEGQTPTILQPTCNNVATGELLTLDRLRELVKADQEGRCVVLPCKVGDKVFQQNGVDIFESQVKKIIYDCGHFAFDEETIGERVFLTRESAEAALKGK